MTMFKGSVDLDGCGQVTGSRCGQSTMWMTRMKAWATRQRMKMTMTKKR